MGNYIIKPFAIAMGLQREMSRMTYLNYYGEKIDIPYLCFYVEGEGKRILVDTACSAADYAALIKRSAKPLRAGGELFKDVVDKTPWEAMLAELGITADQIDYVIQTHLHWDHCMNTVKVAPTTKVIVHEKEVMGGLPPHCIFGFSYAQKDHYERLEKLPGFTTVKGDVQLLPGLSIFETPGHTPGGISVKVQTKAGTHVIAGLCTVDRNYHVPPELREELGYEVIPPGCHTDPMQAYQSMLRIKREADRILPLHEPKLMHEKVIGA
ncbi:MAG: N-acyl homoserine lactonase family protein [Candidatus Rokubacteria bacterium]|nr:N-acyl homoserine lactonase family protein [Candidatus Rokubacteria bacterium]